MIHAILGYVFLGLIAGIVWICRDKSQKQDGSCGQALELPGAVFLGAMLIAGSILIVG